MNKLRYGNFDKLNANYTKGRKGQTAQVIQYINELLKDSKLILDLGCGTGIPTRQLDPSGKIIIGADVSEDMIKEALTFPSHNTSFVVAGSTDIPFNDSTFDSITIFSAFHWMIFHDKTNTMKEINRVLKNGGKIIISKAQDKNDFTKEIKAIFQKYASNPLVSPHDNYFPDQVLKDFGYENIIVKKFNADKTYSYDEAVAYVQSMSSWNVVDNDKKEETLKEVEFHFEQKLKKDKKLLRQIDTEIISAKIQK